MDIVSWVRNQWDRVGAWVLVALGALALVLGWVGVTGTPYTFEQIPYVISGGLGGIFLLGVGAMLWISADLRDEWRKLDRLVELREAQLAASMNAGALLSVEARGTDDVQAVVDTSTPDGANGASSSSNKPTARRREPVQEQER